MKQISIYAVILIIFYLIYSSLNTQKIEHKIDTPKVEKVKEQEFSENKSVDILYLDTEEKQEKKIDNNKVENSHKVDDVQEIENYIIENQLKKIETSKKINNEQIQKHTIYADITKEEIESTTNNMMPPLAPTIVSGTFNSGESYNIIIPTLVKNNAKDIIITNNNEDGTIKESVALKIQGENSMPQQPTILETPPSIGSN